MAPIEPVVVDDAMFRVSVAADNSHCFLEIATATLPPVRIRLRDLDARSLASQLENAVRAMTVRPDPQRKPGGGSGRH